MDVRGGIFRGVATIGVGKVLGQGASFLRSVIIARVLGVENYGVAALFAMTVALFTMITDLATAMQNLGIANWPGRLFI